MGRIAADHLQRAPSTAGRRPAEDVIDGYRMLAEAVIERAVASDRGWFTREPAMAELWLGVAGVDPDAFRSALERWQAGRQGL